MSQNQQSDKENRFSLSQLPSSLKSIIIWSVLLRLPLILVAIAIFLVRNNPFIYVTEPGQATVVFDAFQGIETDRVESPGVTFAMPFVDQPISYDIRTRVWSFTDSADASRASGISTVSNSGTVTQRIGSAITVNSADGQAFALDVFVALRPNPLTLDDLHANIGENYMNTIIVPVIRAKVRDISAEFDSEAFFQKAQLAEIEQKVKELIAQEMPTTQHQGENLPMILIERIFLSYPAFPEKFKESLEKKQVASINAATASVNAEIQAKETERQLILADAEQQAIELKGQAAAANTQLSELLFLEKLEARTHADSDSAPVRITRVEGDSLVFLNVDPR
ncbi:MAG: prohibitin family protein [Cyanothece sp. SIO2G6]|nr:prohibitin family protein [Cyanothece sp. SIO2G6]